MQIGCTYKVCKGKAGKHLVVAQDNAHGTKEIIATCNSLDAATLIVVALEFLCRTAAEHVNKVDKIFTYSDSMSDQRL